MPAQDPVRTFHFSVQWGGTHSRFSEVAGLDQESPVIEYRAGSTHGFSAMKMPAMSKFGNITLKRGVIKADSDFYNWLSTTKTDTAGRRDLVISLLDERHEPVMSWKVKNALPVKLEGPQLVASGNDVAIDSIELAHEGLQLQSE
jgi:phage tail-like protein